MKLSRDYDQFCGASILGMVCELADAHPEATHHYVAGVCPVHGAPARRVRAPRTDFPHCGACGRALIPTTKVARP